MRGRLVRRAVCYRYSVIDIVKFRRDGNVVCRHFEGNFGFGLVAHRYALNRPACKLLARIGCVCRYRNAVAVVCGRLVRRTAIDGYGVVDILVIGGRGDCVCRHFKGEFGFREIQACGVQSRDRPLVKLLARCGRVCGDRYAFARLEYASATTADHVQRVGDNSAVGNRHERAAACIPVVRFGISDFIRPCGKSCNFRARNGHKERPLRSIFHCFGYARDLAVACAFARSADGGKSRRGFPVPFFYLPSCRPIGKIVTHTVAPGIAGVELESRCVCAGVGRLVSRDGITFGVLVSCLLCAVVVQRFAVHIRYLRISFHRKSQRLAVEQVSFAVVFECDIDCFSPIVKSPTARSAF